ncbi:MAG: hypothetical protein FKY71_09920 [Spiribacter salinus]|uniref:Uncharacterized protein n=1 Tax=Spiribacter salinus TaxID=1335746 RepID=A0A540VR24_9GAMM|nr:MAG: hypothetical protein FKY71_09920 [Spiribacter salinus]
MSDENAETVEEVVHGILTHVIERARLKCRIGVAIGMTGVMVAVAGTYSLGIGVMHWEFWAVIAGMSVGTAAFNHARTLSEMADAMEQARDHKLTNDT